MTKTMKNTLKSVLVMAVIAVVAVGLLAVANAFFPEYVPTLDAKTAGLINQVCPSGVDANTAISDGYFAMAEVDKAKLDDINKKLGKDNNNKVLAIYDAKKGDYAGYRVVEAQAQGYGSNPVIITLTSFDGSLKIGKIVVKQQKENPTGENNIFNGAFFEAFLEYAAGKETVGGADDIKGATGATNTSSINGLANAVNLSAQVVKELYGTVSPISPVTGTKKIAALKKCSAAESFSEYTPPDEMRQKVGLYKGDNGDILVSGKARGWGDMELLVKIDGENKIEKVVIMVDNEYIEGVRKPETAAFAENWNDEWLSAHFSGKSLADIQAMDNVLNGTSGATLVKTAPAIKSCLENALGYYPLSTQYIEGIDAGQGGNA